MSARLKQKISTGFVPRAIQKELYQKLRRFNVVLAHRRFGKTVWAINLLIDRALRLNLPMPRLAYLAPTYGEAKRIAWDYLKSYTSKIPGVTYNEAELRVDFAHNGARIMLLSGENPMALKGIYLDLVVLDEYGTMNPIVWTEVVRPALSDRKGSAVFIGTVKGQNHFWKLYEMAIRSDDPEWFGAMFKASETQIVPQEELDSAKKSMTEEEYNQEFECDPLAGLIGAYFAKDLAKTKKEGRIGRFAHDPMLPTDLYFDLGINDVTAVWFTQSFRGRHRHIDYFEICGVGIQDIVAEIKKKPYVTGEWVFPHDVAVRDFSTGRARIQQFNSLGCRPNRIIPRIGTKMESINAARVIFGACEFDEIRCAKGLDALANYQRKWDAKNNVFSETPLHNWASNGSDAFQQFAMGAGQDSRVSIIGGNRYEPNQHLEAESDYNPFAMGG